MAEIYKLKFEDIEETNASPAYMTKEAEAKIFSFNPSERLRNINRTRGRTVLNLYNQKLAA